MAEIRKIIFIKNAVETLGYFSEQIARELERNGYETCFIDYERMYESMDVMLHFLDREETALVTFNFIGLRGEAVFQTESGRSIWQEENLPVLNILVDQPLYYHSCLKEAGERMRVFCVDREHVGYVRRFYPGVKVEFLPLAGNELLFSHGDGEHGTHRADVPEPVLYGQRTFDLVFAANYVSMEMLEEKVKALDDDYRIFYRRITEDLIADPAQSVDAVMERHIRNELGAVPEEQLCAAMSGMIWIDLFVRSYFREKVVQTLADAGIIVRVFGADWEKIHCKKPQNVRTSGGKVNSAACVQAMRDARIALNVMPWFKDGAHDRVFTAMLQGTAALTDDSRYLREECRDGENICFYSLRALQQLPDQVVSLLEDPVRMAELAERGYRMAEKRHRWKNRAGLLMQTLCNIDKYN